MAKAKRSAAQKAATARMVAANRAKRAGATTGAKRSKGSKGAKRSKGSKRSKGKGLARAHGSHDGMALLPFTAKNTQANLRRLALGVSAVAHHSAKTREHVKTLEEGLIRKGVLSSRFSY